MSPFRTPIAATFHGNLQTGLIPFAPAQRGAFLQGKNVPLSQPDRRHRKCPTLSLLMPGHFHALSLYSSTALDDTSIARSEGPILDRDGLYFERSKMMPYSGKEGVCYAP